MANIQDQYHRETSSINPADLQPLPDSSENLFARAESIDDPKLVSAFESHNGFNRVNLIFWNRP